jgi:hypothetical protein
MMWITSPSAHADTAFRRLPAFGRLDVSWASQALTRGSAPALYTVTRYGEFVATTTM